MKKILGFFAAFLMFASFNANAQELKNGPYLEVNKEVHDYGTIEKGGDPYCEFTVTNSGTEPLIISNAKGSCGCTVPEWDREPIMPGKTSKIKVRYDTQRVGPINKTVTLTSNATNEPTKTIRIKGNVKPEAASKAPVKEEGLSPKANG
jgi:hypothetical protein|tara:strand:+ start:97641 stop:98087 length:447 start_codon:yes stop_codon:yes gene_type:complete